MTYGIDPLPEEIRRGVPESLPAISQIKNPELREKVIDAWTLSLVNNGYTKVEEMPGSGVPGGPILGNQAQHINGVTALALAYVDILNSIHPNSVALDRDMLLACALCHDVGKPYEYSPANRERWEADPRVSGLPALRHTMYGAHIALTVGLPEEVVHVCGCHSPEGRLVKRSLPATIVHFGDEVYWQVLECALNWTLPMKDEE